MNIDIMLTSSSCKQTVNFSLFIYNQVLKIKTEWCDLDQRKSLRPFCTNKVSEEQTDPVAIILTPPSIQFTKVNIQYRAIYCSVCIVLRALRWNILQMYIIYFTLFLVRAVPYCPCWRSKVNLQTIAPHHNISGVNVVFGLL